jgi:hypothetical protein
MQLAEFLGASLFPSRIYQHYGRLIAEHRFERPGFKLKLGLKDMRLVRGAADAHEMPMPVASRLRDRLLALAAQGHGEFDWTGIGLAAARDKAPRRPPELSHGVLGSGPARRPNCHTAWARCPRRRSVSTA